MFHPVSTKKSFEEALEQIADAIRSGDYREGERLPSERVLAAQMQISRPTLREALRILSEAGVIEVRTGSTGGTFIRSEIVPTNLIDHTETLEEAEVTEVLQARRLLEPRVAHLAARFGTVGDFAAMERTIDLQRRVMDDQIRFNHLDYQFHVALARASRNRTIVALMRLLLRRLLVARDTTLRGPHQPERGIALHEKTLDAIRRGAPKAIDAAMDQHLRVLEELWGEDPRSASGGQSPAVLAPDRSYDPKTRESSGTK